MSDTMNAVVDGGAAPAAPAKKPAKKAAAKSAKNTKGKAVAKTAKKAAKAAKTPKGPKKETVRFRAVKALVKKNMTATEVAAAVGIQHNLKPTLDQEVERGHLAYANSEEGKAQIYKITAKGKTAVEKGTVDPKRGE